MLMPMLADDADDAACSARHSDALHQMQVAEDESDDVKDEITKTIMSAMMMPTRMILTLLIMMISSWDFTFFI